MKKKRALQSSNLRRQSSTWSILRRCDGRPARCEPGGSETPEVHRANSHSTGRNGQRAPARRRGRKRPARSDGTRSSDARGVARRGADGVVHSYDTRVPPTSAICSERRSDGAALPRLSRCAWRRAAARRQNPSQEARRRPRSTVKCTSFAAPGGHSLLVRPCVSVTFLYPPVAGGTDRRVGSNPLRSARSSWRRARARRRDSVDAVRVGAPEREK